MTHYIHTNGGNKFHYGSILAEVTVADVAHHLANNARYCGATRFHYSVAQHSVLVADLLRRWGADKGLELKGLGHDAHEYVMGDMPTPFQRWFVETFLEGVDWIEAAKARLDTIILPKIGIDADWTDGERHVIKKADHCAFLVEAYQLFDETPEWWTEAVYRYGFTMEEIPLDIRIPRMVPETAKNLFLQRYEELTNGDHGTGAARNCA